MYLQKCIKYEQLENEQWENEQFSKVSKSIFVQYFNEIHNGKGSMPTINKNTGYKWSNINNEHLFLFFYSEKCRKKTDEFSPKWEQLYQAVPEENKTKSNSSFPKKKRDQKYMTLNTF